MLTISITGEDLEKKKDFSYITGKDVKWYNPLENIWTAYYQVKHVLIT